jgi:hypothetical protein
VTDGAEDLTDPEGTGSVPRRPTSLRSAHDESAARASRRPPTPPLPSSGVAGAPGEPPAGAVEPAEPTSESASSPFDPVFERLATAQDRAAAFAGERPEVVVGAAFVGGLILATILKRLGRR